MPELPEVETTLRGVRPHLLGHQLRAVVLRDTRLRWPVVLPADLAGQTFQRASRIAKYLIFGLDRGDLILHLGMSGSLRILPSEQPAVAHDHLDLCLDSGQMLRFNDPRRFGSLHWHPESESDAHWLLRHLGPEPLSDSFDGAYLHRRSRKRRQAVKNFLMDGRVVVGVGNIYANEALFTAGIRPTVQAGRVPLVAYQRLASAVKAVLRAAIDVGGTTLRDYVGTAGEPGYFKQSLNVYGRQGLRCKRCGAILKAVRVGQRASVYCPNCQRAQGFGATG